MRTNRQRKIQESLKNRQWICDLDLLRLQTNVKRLLKVIPERLYRSNQPFNIIWQKIKTKWLNQFK